MKVNLEESESDCSKGDNKGKETSFLLLIIALHFHFQYFTKLLIKDKSRANLEESESECSKGDNKG